MLRLHATQLSWIDGRADDPDDQCAHGKVELVADGQPLYRTGDEDVTLSAACLFLLRTIEDDHTPDQSVADGNWLFPCCGSGVYRDPGRYDVCCLGCNIGTDVFVRHAGADVLLSGDGGEARVSKAEWTAAVLGLVAQVEAFYAACTPKVRIADPDDREGWDLFWSEWTARKARAKAAH